ncbi:MAG TPA: heparinase II/III family protein [Dissulfurispiraceae bacterium]|nr:heparinase II/III family protein [Dissulfurispiraceae bacterium]
MRLRRLSNDKVRLDVAVMLPSEDFRIDHLQLPDFLFHTDDAIVQRLLEGGSFTPNGDRHAIEQFERASLGKFYADITTERTGPDIRMVWEPARLQHITVLLLYGVLKQPGADTVRAGEKAKEVIFHWLSKNPFLTGPHYISPMECGLRIPVFFYALKILDDLTPEQRREIIETIYRHAWLVSKRLSLFSSLGNHTICECTGLIFAGSIFSTLPIGRNWLERGYELLSDQVHHQILDDGGPAEQSLAYHRFVLDLCWLAVGFLTKNKLYGCENVTRRLLSGEQFLQCFLEHDGTFPAIGDSDDGMAIAPGIEPGIKVSQCQSVRV